jgi:hypothetical protein
MKKLMRRLLPLACAAVAALAVTAQAPAGVSCHKINAKGSGQDLGTGTTIGDASGGGLLQGTTTGNFGIVGGAPPVFTIAGTVLFTTHQGTLTVGFSGPFDVSTGAFAGSGPVIASSGKLAGATGSLTFAGVEDLSTGTFTQTITGSICVDLSP